MMFYMQACVNMNADGWFRAIGIGLLRPRTVFLFFSFLFCFWSLILFWNLNLNLFMGT